MELTPATVSALTLPAGKTEAFFWDDGIPGFGVRLRGGSRTFIIQYRVGRRQRRESLGLTTKLRLADARRVAQKRFAQIELGQDPAGERKLAEQAEAAKTPFAATVALYLKSKKGEIRPTTLKAAELHLQKYWAGLNLKALDSIRRADVAVILQSIINEHGRTAAARARSNLQACFSWAMEQGLVENNPTAGTSNPDPKTSRDRVLTDDELKTIWNACLDDNFGKIIRLLTLTGCRRNEIGGLRFDEIDLQSGTLTIPGERIKNGRTLQLTLPAAALEILRSVPRREGQVFVFENQRKPTVFCNWSGATVLLNGRIAKATGQPLRAWSLHDVRRSVRTGLSKLGVPPHVAELCIGHVRTGVMGTYDRHAFQKEISVAFERWSAHVADILEDRPSDNVISMPSPWRSDK
jgi:integrase